MIEALISSKTRIKLLLKFFLNSKTTSYLRGLESEFGESSNAIRLELNRFEKAGMLQSFSEGNKKMFQANTNHPLFEQIHAILLKHIGIDKIVDDVVERLGDVHSVYLVGDLAKGKESKVIDLLFVGKLDKSYLVKLIDKVEKLISRKVKYLIYSLVEFERDFAQADFAEKSILIWNKDQ